MLPPGRLATVRLPISLKIFGIAVGILLMMIVVTVLSSISLRRVGQQLDLLADYYIELDQHMGDIRDRSLREVIQIERVLHSKTKLPPDSDAMAQAFYKEVGNCEPETMRPVIAKINGLYPQRGERQLMVYQVNRRCTNAHIEQANLVARLDVDVDCQVSGANGIRQPQQLTHRAHQVACQEERHHQTQHTGCGRN